MYDKWQAPLNANLVLDMYIFITSGNEVFDYDMCEIALFLLNYIPLLTYLCDILKTFIKARVSTSILFSQSYQVMIVVL